MKKLQSRHTQGSVPENMMMPDNTIVQYQLASYRQSYAQVDERVASCSRFITTSIDVERIACTYPEYHKVGLKVICCVLPRMSKNTTLRALRKQRIVVRML